jgi:hypothetical protein
MVTEFGLSMTAVAIALNTISRLKGEFIVVLLTLFGLSFFLLIISNHMTRINDDRISAGRKKTELLNKLNMSVSHGGFSGKRKSRFGFSAPNSMVFFCWVVFTVMVSATISYSVLNFDIIKVEILDFL